jgi:hypothetical protein
MTKLSPCGFACRDCEAYRATQNHDLEVLKRHQADYKAHFGKDISLDELYCDGCLEDGRKISFCFQCEIRQCAIKKGFDTCAQCSDFPCEKGKFIWDNVSESQKNLESLRQLS